MVSVSKNFKMKEVLSQRIAFLAGCFGFMICTAVSAQTPKNYSFHRVDTSINSEFEEIQPLTSRDGQTMFFVRSANPKNTGGKLAGQDIWKAKRTGDTTWSVAENVGLPVNNRENNAILGISGDGKAMLVTNIYLKKKMDPGICLFVMGEDGKWGQPINQVIKDFTIQKGTLGGFWLKDEKTLILTMKSEGSVGREDLYVTFREADGTWSKPLNLGKEINTPGFEISPFYSEEDSLLYFASNDHQGKGDADVYVTKRLDETWTKWTKPMNLGPFFNGEGFDAYFTISTSDSTIYMTKENPDNGEADIYFTHLGNLKEALKRLAEGKKPKDASTATTSRLERERREQLAQDSAMRELDARQRIVIGDFSNVLFDFAKFNLRPESRTRLDKLYEYLVSNPTVGVELIGHADSIDTELINLILSVRRSEECKQYLINKGISKRRILTHGFGKQLPASTNRTDEGRQMNRRCEINILPDNKVKSKLDSKPAGMGNETDGANPPPAQPKKKKKK